MPKAIYANGLALKGIRIVEDENGQATLEAEWDVYFDDGSVRPVKGKCYSGLSPEQLNKVVATVKATLRADYID